MRELQTLRVPDGARNDLPPGSVLAGYVESFRREYGFAPPKFLDTNKLRAADGHLLDGVRAQMSALLSARMGEHGFRPADIEPWTDDMSLYTTDADVTRMVRWAVAFRSHGAAQADAREWWNTFTSLHWSLRYRARGHTPDSAREVFRAFPQYIVHKWHWTPTMLETSHAWAMTALPPERVHAYLRVRVSPREALRELSTAAEN